MPISVESIINEVVREIGDAPKNRILEQDWIQFYNDTLESMTRRYKVLEQDATFDIEIEDRYLYPEDMVQMKRLSATSTPSDPESYREVREKFEDEIRDRERWGKPLGDSYEGYWARATFLQLTPKPTVAVTDGLLISYWKLATRITVVADVELELPAMFRSLVRDRMLIFAKRRLTRYDEMAADLAAWEAELALSAPPIEDRSDDRRSALRPRSARRGFEGQV